MFAQMTVEEQILFSANLRLPKKYTQEQRTTKANGIIVELGLSHVKNVRIGDALKRGVSGGERKRVNIGTELVTDPSLIFLDGEAECNQFPRSLRLELPSISLPLSPSLSMRCHANSSRPT